MKRIKKQVGTDSKAFTIIEVVLVLAVAGLIFLVVFAAIPRLQASRRDNQRKRDAEAMFSLAIEYQANTGTTLTNAIFQDAFDATPGGAFHSYTSDSNFTSPTGGNYMYVGSNDPGVNANQVFFGSGRFCSANNDALNTGGDATEFGILMALERGEYCIDSR